MYTESTSTGINFIDLSRREVMMIYFALKRCAVLENIPMDERSAIGLLIRRIAPEAGQVRHTDSPVKIGNDE